MTAPAPSAVAAVVQYLLRDAYVAELCGALVWGEDIPKEDLADGTPRKAVLVKSTSPGAGGIGDASNVELDAFGLDVWNFGRDFDEAGQVRRATRRALKDLARFSVEDTLLHSAIKLSGPTSLRDPDTRWPFVLETWQVLAGEESTAAA